MAGRRLLILGGTTEAAALARALDGAGEWEVVTSLAGRTRAPAALPGAVRIGGFGGADGLASYLRSERIDRVVDATHPFAATMSANAAAACAEAGVPLLRIARPAWTPVPGDRWIEVADAAEAADWLAGALPAGAAVLLTLGRQEVAPFKRCPALRFVLRSIEPPVPEDLPPDCLLLSERGPFTLDGERALIARHGIRAVVAKNAGGDATAAKLAAAREAAIPVVMIRRPAPPATPAVAAVAGALDWLRA
ncbi:cobalt-precorrin-6A reductase [Inquilinus sp. Marseille-Q2685]|uniref:cobalt-precorrin-6A reductase n=1 Tax=Inquilinus sp. Marseille-Q2685 TaxID=2866581 RepID=UPI001CE4903B|nr:cobalt-precorrin-6A reductase [Inquilinus sp. Marseille-Q2685]